VKQRTDATDCSERLAARTPRRLSSGRRPSHCFPGWLPRAEQGLTPAAMVTRRAVDILRSTACRLQYRYLPDARSILCTAFHNNRKCASQNREKAAKKSTFCQIVSAKIADDKTSAIAKKAGRKT